MRIVLSKCLCGQARQPSTNASSGGIRKVADKAAAAGFEEVLLSFGSGFDPSSTDSKYISEKKADTEYVESKGLMLGGQY